MTTNPAALNPPVYTVPELDDTKPEPITAVEAIYLCKNGAHYRCNEYTISCDLSALPLYMLRIGDKLVHATEDENRFHELVMAIDDEWYETPFAGQRYFRYDVPSAFEDHANRLIHALQQLAVRVARRSVIQSDIYGLDPRAASLANAAWSDMRRLEAALYREIDTAFQPSAPEADPDPFITVQDRWESILDFAQLA